MTHFPPPELQGAETFDQITRTANHDNFDLARFWTSIEAIPSPETLIPNITNIAVKPTPLPKKFKLINKVDSIALLWLSIFPVGVAILCCLNILVMLFVPDTFTASQQDWILGTMLFLLLIVGPGGSLLLKRCVDYFRKNEHTRRQHAHLVAQKMYDYILNKCGLEASQKAFAKKKKDLLKLRDKYHRLSVQKETEIANLYATEDSLNAGAEELQRLSQEAIKIANTIAPTFQEASRNLAQTRIDLSII